MARYYRRGQNYGRKNKPFFRSRGRYGGYSRGYSQAPREYQSQPRADVNVVVGRKRIWIFNNTEDVVAILPGQYVVLEIVREGDNQLGHFFRATVLGDGKAAAQAKAPEAPEERPQDWV
jgi:hypothetical protein